MNLIDAINTTGLVSSFAHLSLHHPFERGHSSLYAALKHGSLDVVALQTLLSRTLVHAIASVTTWV
ncbi:hypothetical protein [Deinococcus pimensis]|uniref:hypothetical protein n=1 Tax=Deinococcus pimensis TaxID=309888 RepID=UPI00048025CA|nr:hypothetical protein [Deinococcus pimensis]